LQRHKAPKKENQKGKKEEKLKKGNGTKKEKKEQK
jgi:hypothetical protein